MPLHRRNIKVGEVLSTYEWYVNGEFSFGYHEAAWHVPVVVSGGSSACLLDNTGDPHVTGAAPGSCIVEITAKKLLSTDPYTFGPTEIRSFTINVT